MFALEREMGSDIEAQSKRSESFDPYQHIISSTKRSGTEDTMVQRPPQQTSWPTVHASQSQLQEGTPMFIRNYTSLRALCLQHTDAKIRALEIDISNMPPGPQRNAKLGEATELLRQLDTDIANKMRRVQIDDPEYAASHGISLTHFTIGPSSPNSGDWMMLSNNWGLKSPSITEDNVQLLSELHRKWLDEFAGDAPNLEKVYFKRSKTQTERLPGSVLYGNGDIVVLQPSRIRLWRALISLAVFVLIVFFAVGIIATTTQFSKIFIKSFFIIAIVWTFSSSVLLCWLVSAFGGNKRDVVGSFLAAIAIWLVVLQIGQTKLSAQLQNAS